MYISIYIFRINKANVEEHLSIEREGARIYLEHGAIFNDAYRASRLTGKYGCVGFADAIDVSEDEEMLVSLTGFKDQSHHDKTMNKVNSDPKIRELFARAKQVVALDRTVYGEFELVT